MLKKTLAAATGTLLAAALPAFAAPTAPAPAPAVEPAAAPAATAVVPEQATPPEQAALGEGGAKLSATLSGAEEVPGPGDTAGQGVFTARVNPGKGEVCYTLQVGSIDTPTGAHIHSGKAGVAGAVAVTLEAPADGSTDACVSVAKDLAMALIKTPGDYYVNVHNAKFPNGAVRGQLVK